MAMHMSRKIIRQISSRRLMAGTGGDLGGTRQGTRSYHTSYNHYGGYYESFRQWLLGLPKIPGGPGPLILAGLWINDVDKKRTEKAEKMEAERKAKMEAERKALEAERKASLDQLKKKMQEKGITRADLHEYERLLKLSTSGLNEKLV